MNIPEELIPLVDWWQKDGKKTLALVACVGIVALAVYLWFAREKRLDEEAATIAYGTSTQEMVDLNAALEKYGDRDVASVIKLRLAKEYLVIHKDVDGALDVYKQLINDKSLPAAFKYAPEMGAAFCYEKKGDWAAAREIYASCIDGDGAASPYTLDARLGEARCLAFAGEREQALKKLDEIKAAYASDMLAGVSIESTVDAVKRWQERKPAQAPAAAPVPVAAPAPVAAKTPVEDAPASQPAPAKAPVK